MTRVSLVTCDFLFTKKSQCESGMLCASPVAIFGGVRPPHRRLIFPGRVSVKRENNLCLCCHCCCCCCGGAVEWVANMVDITTGW